MPSPILTPETFRFFRDLARNNRTEWMRAHRSRYEEHVVARMRALLEALAPLARALHADFDTRGRVGTSFSRINRDTRFARDKRPYRAQMYLLFSRSAVPDDGQLYVGVGAQAVTAGFRIYDGGRESTLRRVARANALESPKWLAAQARRLGSRYESYWYSSVRGAWTRQDGFPTRPEQWGRLQGWVVRRTFSTAAAARPGFPGDVERVFKQVFPLYAFTSLVG
jgi:uncharacterized protein (TIGR02453 family)